MPLDRVLPFAVLAFAIIVVPGPSVLFVVGRALAHGRRVAMASVVGNAAGVYVQVIAVAVGLGAIIERSEALFTLIKLGGAVYLLWLGIQAFRHRGSAAAALTTGAPTAGGERLGRAVRDGFVVGAMNPKAIVFFGAILPQFVDPSLAPAPLQMLIFGLVFIAIALASDGAWALAAGTARSWFLGSPQRLGRVQAAGGIAMITLAAHLALTGRPTRT